MLQLTGIGSGEGEFQFTLGRIFQAGTAKAQDSLDKTVMKIMGHKIKARGPHTLPDLEL